MKFDDVDSVDMAIMLINLAQMLGTKEERAKRVLETIFEWEPIGTAPRIKNKPILIYWRRRIQRSGPRKYKFFVAERHWWDGTADNEPQNLDATWASWVPSNFNGFEEPIYWLPMIPTPKVEAL